MLLTRDSARAFHPVTRDPIPLRGMGPKLPKRQILPPLLSRGHCWIDVYLYKLEMDLKKTLNKIFHFKYWASPKIRKYYRKKKDPIIGPPSWAGDVTICN